MSRAKPRGAAIAERLSEALQDDLADIASTMGWIDSAPSRVDAPGSQPDLDDAAALLDPVEGAGVDSSLDLMLDDFASAVDAMFSARHEVMSLHGDEGGAPADGGARSSMAGEGTSD